jgi:NADH-quinone oxidoreductase subunit C
MAITKVWIEEGCIVCNACEAECPDVFHVTADSCHIKGESRVDGAENENRDGKSPLKAELQRSLEDSIVAAAAGCPVSVIVYEQVANAPEAPKAEAPAAPAPEPVKAPEPVAVAAPAPAPPKPAEPAKADGPRITKVWIEEGCIVCNACEAECGEVFHVTADSCHIKADSRVDGKEDENRAAKSPVKGDMGAELHDKIVAAAAGCPVNVIKYEGTGVAASASAPAEAKAEAAGPYVWDIKSAPNRQVAAPKTAPVPSFKAYQAEVAAQFAADEAKYQKALADYEVAKAKAAEEGKPEPKAPVRAAAKKDENDVVTPFPQEAKDADLLFLAEQLGDKVEEIFEQAGELVCQVKKEAILEVLQLCKERPELKYEMLADQAATHYPVAKDFAFSVVYHLTSLSRRKRLRVRILVPEGFEVPSACGLYPSANWMEREIYDMLGIRFTDHPDMTRILCPEDWEGFPLRKEYPTLGLGQRDIDFREDRSGVLMRMAMEKAGNMGINLTIPKAE